MTRDEVLAYQRRWRLVEDREITELRAASAEHKLRQVAALMARKRSRTDNRTVPRFRHCRLIAAQVVIGTVSLLQSAEQPSKSPVPAVGTNS